MIGVYDSGVGGLTILDRIRGLLPNADLVYLADQANVPYGERSLATVRSLALTAVGTLVEHGATTVVVACNTASAAALDDLRAAFPTVRMVGMEPAVKPAATSTRTGVVGVLATDATFAAAGFEELVGRFAEGVEVIAYPCPGWAAAIEESWPTRASAEIARHLAPLLERGVDSIVLACTHYGFVAGTIADVIGDRVLIVDPADAVARQAVRVSDHDGSGMTTYLTTGSPQRLAAQMLRLLDRVVRVDQVESSR